MKKLISVVLAVAMLASISGVVLAANPSGMPNGQHYNLNIIGVKNPKDAMGDKEGGHVIFVDLYSGPSAKRVGEVETCIKLAAAPLCTDADPGPACEDFYVIDGNGTDDGLATFQLPADVATEWQVWVRANGKPTGEADMQLCAWDPTANGGEGGWYCNVDVVQLRGHNSGSGKQKFTNVTSQLLTIGGEDLFSPVYEDYFWSYRNSGQKLAQLRFYPNP